MASIFFRSAFHSMIVDVFHRAISISSIPALPICMQNCSFCKFKHKKMCFDLNNLFIISGRSPEIKSSINFLMWIHATKSIKFTRMQITWKGYCYPIYIISITWKHETDWVKKGANRRTQDMFHVNGRARIKWNIAWNVCRQHIGSSPFEVYTKFSTKIGRWKMWFSLSSNPMAFGLWKSVSNRFVCTQIMWMNDFCERIFFSIYSYQKRIHLKWRRQQRQKKRQQRHTLTQNIIN